MSRINLAKVMALFSWAVIAGVSSLAYPSLGWTQPSRVVNTKFAISPVDQRIQKRLIPLLLAKQEDYDFSGDGRSGDRKGGGSRSGCPSLSPPLTALIPESNQGKTVVERPTFWFYVPYSSEQVPVGEFVLQDEGDNDIYRIRFTLPKTQGFVSISLPEALKINQWYRWYFNLYCDRHKSSTPIIAEGWVQRIAISPALQKDLKVATLPPYQVYATHQLWYDAIASLAELRLAHPSDTTLDRDWTNLLKAKGVNLELSTQEPIVGSVVIIHQ